MRAEQKIIVSCRQTGERAERLLEWLDQSRMMLRAQDRALRIEVQGIANELLTIVEAVEQPPAAGLIGAWGSARAELVGAMMDDGPASTPARRAPSVTSRQASTGVTARARRAPSPAARAPRPTP